MAALRTTAPSVRVDTRVQVNGIRFHNLRDANEATSFPIPSLLPMADNEDLTQSVASTASIDAFLGQCTTADRVQLRFAGVDSILVPNDGSCTQVSNNCSASLRGGRWVLPAFLGLALTIGLRGRLPPSGAARARTRNHKGRSALGALACAPLVVTLGGSLCLGVAGRAHGLSAPGVVEEARLRYIGAGAADGLAAAFRQRDDRTCGAAAIAYLLTRLRDRVFEGDVLAALRPDSDEGFSFAELRAFADLRGFDARGFQGALGDLPREGRPPVLAHMRAGHYVVVHSISTASATFFDPALGATVRSTRESFESAWSGLYLEVRTRQESALRVAESG